MSHPFTQLTEKRTVVLLVGSRFIRAGFAGEAVPEIQSSTSDSTWIPTQNTIYVSGSGNHALDHRRNIKSTHLTPLHLHSTDLHRRRWLWSYDMLAVANSQHQNYFDAISRHLERLLYDIYTDELLVDPKSCQVIVVDPVLFPTPLKSILTEALLHRLHAHSVVYLPEPVLSCIAAGTRNALVVDLGWHNFTVTPVYDLRIIHNGLKSTNRAGMRLHYEMVDALGESDFGAIESLITEVCYCDELGSERPSAPEDSETFSTRLGVSIPNHLRHLVLEKFMFPETETPDDEEHSLLDIISEALDTLPIDVRATLSSSIVFTGGLANIPGLRTRILREMRGRKPGEVAAISGLGPWAGASMYSNYVARPHKTMEVRRDKYLEAVGSYPMPDWLENIYRNPILE
ncbi:hypothetical protein BABINDRAFT_9019 [Babjeviella inositovora NRRL Y-12698]|uniref:Actin-like protein ARP6 n=1 Tax=Babjeviella inositovora NRRL Y-12698 TaxID=984486 RepID=A0A1E3QM58_9ASCO|nr:uncharacterized protein BABINDRAFT_9019 [Babjeviella inositovora NRRL Y-12698]ODQ78783.1 hypothetical protein BABINDRAFT_9019 [Babjeviella inositovora NRRL Y-12698]